MFHRRLFAPALILGLIAVLTLVVGCGDKDEERQVQVLATVGDRVVDADYFQARLVKLKEEQLPRDDDGAVLDMSTLAGKRAFLDVIIDKELMVAKAVELGYLSDTEVEAAMRSLIDYHSMEHYWIDEIGDPSKFVSDEDVEYYYSRLGEQRDCHFIISDTEMRAKAAIVDAQAGKSWAEIVELYHDAPLVGDRLPTIRVGWGQYRDSFEAPVFAVAEGEVTAPIPTEHGWWVLRVDEVLNETRPPLEAIKAKVLISIAGRNKNLRRDALIRELREARNFFLDEEVLKVIFAGLPESEELFDPETNQPRSREQLEPLDVASEDYDRILISYDLTSGPVVLTVADIKSQFDNQNVFSRPKRSELLGGLRTKLTQTSEKTMLRDEIEQRGYHDDQRVKDSAMRRIEETLVEKVNRDLVVYDQRVESEELHAFWDEHHAEYDRPERRAGEMVLCRDAKMARQAGEVVASGAMTWQQVNDKYGIDTELAETFGRTAMVRADADTPTRHALFGLELDEISEPYPLRDGWAVVQLTKIVPPTPGDYDEMAEAVKQRILGRRQDEVLRAKLGEWAEEFPVIVDEELLATMPSWQEALDAAGEAALTIPADR